MNKRDPESITCLGFITVNTRPHVRGRGGGGNGFSGWAFTAVGCVRVHGGWWGLRVGVYALNAALRLYDERLLSPTQAHFML